MKKIGIIDTAYSRVDMTEAIYRAFDNFQRTDLRPVELIRATVPGHKELAVGALQLLEFKECDICIVLGWVGPKDSDQISAHEASLAIAMAKVKTSCHILECFIFEAQHDETAVVDIANNRAIAHLKNAMQLVSNNPLNAITSSIGDREGEPNAHVLNRVR